MKPTNEMSVSFLSCSANESFGRAAVAAFAAQLDPTIDELSDIKTAVSEAVTNCIVHAYQNSIGVIYINCKLYDNGRIAIRIRDKGCGIEDIGQAMQPLFTTAGDERAGLGFAVMESFMDKLRVTSKLGHGTSVAMYKTIERRPMQKTN
ncbi:MAG: anti-sigma factor [Caproiciproducens sp.]|nr:anti-sigma factor [Caproiciproducens sp.]